MIAFVCRFQDLTWCICLIIITPYIRMLDSDWLIAVIFFINSGLALWISGIFTSCRCICNTILQIPWKKVKSYANTPTWSKNSGNSQCKAWIYKKYHGY
jgi:hypothetical protein